MTSAPGRDERGRDASSPTGIPGRGWKQIARRVAVARWPVIGALVIAALAVLYRVAPDRDDARWVWVSSGAVAATITWLAASILFSVYTSQFGSYNETYGSLGAVVILMLWLFLSAFVVLAGAEVNCEVERQTSADSTTGPERPIGVRGAHAADTVASGPDPRR